jgi:branched-chain amino acid transport system substrate-binding protein
MKKIFKILIAAVAIIILIAVINVNNKQINPDAESVKIGVVYGLTGSAAAWSDFGKKAVDLAVKDINNAGGINGRKVEVIYEDSQTSPINAVSAFNKLVDFDKVEVVVGDVWSFVTNPMISVANSKEIVLISPTVMDASVENGGDYFFSLAHTIESQRSAVEIFFKNNTDIKTAYSLCWDDAWGNANSGLLKEIAIENGVEILGEDCTADFGATYQNEAAKIREANPDLILLTTAFTEIPVKKIRDLGIESKILTTSILIDATETRGVEKNLFNNVYFTNWIPKQSFADRFYEEYGTQPWIEAQNHYETIISIAKAFEKSDNILEGLKQVKYEGVAGEIDFTTGDQIRVNKEEAKLYTISNDEYVEIK